MGADRRKLIAEIDKVFRKVDEGVEEFENIMVKMQEANSENQREKFQDDLKKEIKKLQRQRDQIKGWQNSNDVKDKDRLVNYRRIIEQRMEQFKEIERENKTKSYSKQGLQSQDKLDPKEQMRHTTIDWIQGCIEELTTQCDYLECNVESLSGSAGKKKKQQSNEREVDEFRVKLDRHKFHICQLEVIMRLLNNDSLDCSQVSSLKEDLEDYISRNQEPDFIENEYIYEDLKLGDLTEITQQLGNVTNIGTLEEAENNSEENTTGSGSPSPSPVPSHGREGKDEPLSAGLESPKLRHTSGELWELKAAKFSALPRSTPTTPLKLTNQISADSALSSPPLPATPPPPPGIPYNSIAARGPLKQPSFPVPASPKANFDSTFSGPGENVDSLLRQKVTPSPGASNSAGVNSGFSAPNQPPPSSPIAPNRPIPTPTFPTPQQQLQETLILNRQHSSPVKQPNNLPVLNGPLEEAGHVLPLKSLAESSAQQLLLLNSGSGQDQHHQDSIIDSHVFDYLRPTQNSTPREAKIPPILGASPLGKVSMTGESQSQLGLLEAAINQRMPLPMDSERLRVYVVRNPCPTPAYYPPSPPLLSETLEYFNRLQPETLFFIFYYMEGTKAQYLAAKALKKQSWRFHKKYLMWFQRHEEPVCITDDFEQGTYVYFDFEKWSQRKKENFTFEYQFLEDRDLN